ncbi:MAG: hypothetical protein AB7P07_15045 [Hyphomonadaceae bacterium]
MIKALGPAALFALAACATAPAAPAPPPSPIGALYHYVRSNQDGTLPEQIYQYRASDTALEVGKVVSRCANAAFVTADMDLDRGHGVRFVGGRIAEDATQEPFAYLTYDADARTLHANVEAAGIDQDVPVPGAPFVLYDFDLSDLNALYAGRPAPRENLRFAAVLIWPPDAPNIFRTLDWSEARYAALETHLGRDAVRYDVSGGLNGALWLDARDGHVIEARFAEPNHAEYADFRMVLQSVTHNGADEWLEVRQAHWRDCPAE